jgi:hypothetical protein
MKPKTILTTVGVLFVGAAMGFAADAHLGTWKLNEAKSNLAAGAVKNHTVVYAAAGDSVKVTVDGVDKDGKPTHNEWTGKFDGKEYPLTGSLTADTRAYTEVDDHTLTFAESKGGKVTISGRIVVSADGKSRTVTTSATNAQGAKINTTAVYDKQ